MPRREKGDQGVSKYMAKKCQVDGIKFDSLKEARRLERDPRENFKRYMTEDKK